MDHDRLEVLYEDNHLLAVNKPAGLPTMGVAADTPSLFHLAAQYIKRRYDKPGNVYLGVVSRLDAATTGVVLLARTSKAAARLSQQFRTREVEKTYWALVSRPLDPPSGQWTDWLVKDEWQQRMIVCDAARTGAKEARLAYRQLSRLDRACLVEIELFTGRKHQIRVQFAARGHAILGETKYARAAPFPSGIALHSRRLLFAHPVRKEPIELVAPLPAAWRQCGVSESMA